LWGQIYKRKSYARNIFFIFFLAPIVLTAFWPRLWYEPFSNLVKFYLYHVKHNPVNVFYLGKTYGAQIAPWHYPFLLLVTTVPLATLLLSIYGIRTYIKKHLKDEILGMAVINILFLLILMSLPIAQKYDGIRLFMPVFPFLAVLAGAGFSELHKRVSIVKKYKFLPNTLYLLLLPALITLIRIHPYQTSYYNMFIGGIRGAHKLGMETTYWGDCITEKTIKFINNNTPKNGRIIFYPVGSFVSSYYKDMLRKDIEITDINDEDFDYLILLSRQGMFNDKLWKIYKYAQSIYEVSYQGVPFLKIYKRDGLYNNVLSGFPYRQTNSKTCSLSCF
jgi:hypothetical protein